MDKEFIEYIKGIYDVFSGEKNVDLLLALDQKILENKDINIFSPAVTYILKNIPVHLIAGFVFNLNEEKENRDQTIGVYRTGLEALAVKNTVAAIFNFKKVSNSFSNLVKKDILIQKETYKKNLLWLHSFDKDFFLYGYYRKMLYYCTRAFLASVLETYCYKLSGKKIDLENSLKRTEFYYYLRLFYLKNKIGLEELKTKIDTNRLVYRYGSGSCDLPEDGKKILKNMYDKMKEEEDVFIKISKNIFNKEVSTTFNDIFKFHVDTIKRESTGLDFRVEIYFDWMPDIFKDAWYF